MFMFVCKFCTKTLLWVTKTTNKNEIKQNKKVKMKPETAN